MNDELFRIAHNAIERSADTVMQAARQYEQHAMDLNKPHVYMRPRVFLDQPGVWCCMYGDCLATCPAGFGDSPARACADFDRRWLWSTAEIDKHEAARGGEQG
jgi:hypothetical protein